MTHFKYPLLQCDKMVVKSHRATTSRRQKIREHDSDRVLSTNDPAKVVPAPFVTKVHIKKTIDYDVLNKIEAANITQPSKKGKIDNQKGDQKVDFKEGGAVCNKKEEKKKKNQERFISSESETTKFKRVPRARSACSIGLTPVEDPESSEYEDLQHLIKKLTLKKKERDLVSKLGRKERTVPLSTYARPTKGELALNLKAPGTFRVGGNKGGKKLHKGNVMRPLWTPVFGASYNHDRLSPDITLRGSSARTVPELVAPRNRPRAPRSTPDRNATPTFDRGQYLCRRCKNPVCVRVPNCGELFYDRQIATEGVGEHASGTSESSLQEKMLGEYI